MHETRRPGTRAAAVYVVITLVCIAAFSGTHAHVVGHAEEAGPLLTAPSKAESTALVCLSCQLNNSPLENVGAPAAPDPVELRGDGLSPIDSRLPTASLRRSGCTRAPPHF